MIKEFFWQVGQWIVYCILATACAILFTLYIHALWDVIRYTWNLW